MLQPFGDPAFRMNLLAAICLGAAAGTTVILARTLTRSTALGVLAGLGLGLAPAAWAIGTHAETHALHLAIAAALLCLLVGWEDRARDPAPERQARADRWLVAAAFVFGLAMGNHSLTLLLAPPIALFVFAVDPRILRRRRLVAACAAVLAVTIVVLYLELPLRAGPFRAPLVYGRPETWDGFWYVVLAEQFQGSISDPFGNIGGKVLALITRATGQFGPLTVLIPVGLPRHRRPATAVRTADREHGRDHLVLRRVLPERRHRALLPRAVAHGLDLAGDPGAFIATVAANLLARLAATSWGQPSTPRFRRVASVVAIGFAVVLIAPTLVAAPARYRTVNESADRSAAHWVDRALQLMAPDAVIVSWWSHSTPLWYAQRVEGRRPDLEDRRRQDDPGRRTGRHLHGDRCEPRGPPRLRHPR